MAYIKWELHSTGLLRSM